MKTLCIIVATLVIAASKSLAATNILYTTTTNRTLAVTATGKSVIEGTNAAAIRSLLSITNATGLEATAAALASLSNSVPPATNTMRLNGTNVATGTNVFPAAKFFLPNGIPSRVLLVTNLNFVGDIVGRTNGPPGFSEGTYVAKFTLPALLGSNSAVRLNILRWQTNAVLASTYWNLYGGTSTNFLSSGTSLGTAVITNLDLQRFTFANNSSFTQQIVNVGNQQSTAWTGLASVDTSAPWPAWLTMSHSSAPLVSTNVFASTVLFEEVIIP